MQVQELLRVHILINILNVAILMRYIVILRQEEVKKYLQEVCQIAQAVIKVKPIVLLLIKLQ